MAILQAGTIRPEYKDTMPMNYKFLDPLISAGAGAIIAFTVTQIIPASMPMALAMLAGGVLGMGFKMLFTVLLAPFCGAFQVMMPLGLIGMPLGMAVAMAHAAGTAPPGPAMLAGAGFGLAIAFYIRSSDRRLTGGH
jgi:hypothetical protein